MIYVTHDQTEALTFADQVVVMQDGVVVQIGSPVDLFERPQHTFVGHFIGSPGMNILDAEVQDGTARFQGHRVALEGPIARTGSRNQIGVRPEYVRLADHGIPATVRRAADIGRHSVVEALVGDTRVSAVIDAPPPAAGAAIHLHFIPDQTRLYADGWIATEGVRA